MAFVLTSQVCPFFFFNDTATTEIYTLSLHDALPILRISPPPRAPSSGRSPPPSSSRPRYRWRSSPASSARRSCRSEEHTSELQSQSNLVCRLLLEKKKFGCSPAHPDYLPRYRRC